MDETREFSTETENGKVEVTKRIVKKPILRSIPGYVTPGSVTAIMGPSGAGKTSLLNFLCGRQDSGQASGSLFLNGREVSPSDVRKIAGFVTQDDILMGSQTPREALRFSADLELGDSVSENEKDAAVEAIIQELGLQKCCDSLIGYVGSDAQNSGLSRGISGGERKRLSIGIELLSQPSIIFLDEPTSGLDSFTAASIIRTLCDLAREGRTIVMTIHQPSSDIFDMFDNFMLLARGRCAYFGPRVEVVDYFSNLGYTCPELENPADYFLRVLHGDVSEDGLADNVDLEKTEDFSHADEQAVKLYNAYQESDLKDRMLVTPEPPPAVNFRDLRKEQSSFWKQFSLLLKRGIVDTWREPMHFRATIGQFLFISLLVGLIYLRLGKTETDVQNRAGALFFLVVGFAVFGSVSPVFLLPAERNVFLHESNRSLYSSGSYYLAKVVSELPLFILNPLICGCIAYWMVGFNDGADRFFTYIGVTVMLYLTSFALGVVIVGLFPDPAVAISVAPLFWILLMMFAGFYIGESTIPVYFTWIRYINFVSYGLRSLIVNEFQGVTLNVGAGAFFSDGNGVLSFYGYAGAEVWKDVVTVVGFCVAMHIIGFLLLLLAASRKKGHIELEGGTNVLDAVVEADLIPKSPSRSS